MDAALTPEPINLPPAPRLYTADDIFFFLGAGLLDPDAKFELMDGEIVPMSPKGRHHEALREELELWLREPWSLPFNIIREHTLKLDDGTLLEPDFLLYDGARRIADAPLTGSDIKLAIEVADSSWGRDTKPKAAKYAAFGIQDYWALHAVKRIARIHRGPGVSGWAEVANLKRGDKLAPLCAPTADWRL
jgi:Uma2 family endonuclease